MVRGGAAPKFYVFAVPDGANVTVANLQISNVTEGCPPPATDQRAVDRPQDGAGAALCDIGAFELDATASSP